MRLYVEKAAKELLQQNGKKKKKKYLEDCRKTKTLICYNYWKCGLVQPYFKTLWQCALNRTSVGSITQQFHSQINAQHEHVHVCTRLYSSDFHHGPNLEVTQLGSKIVAKLPHVHRIVYYTTECLCSTMWISFITWCWMKEGIQKGTCWMRLCMKGTKMHKIKMYC